MCKPISYVIGIHKRNKNIYFRLNSIINEYRRLTIWILHSFKMKLMHLKIMILKLKQDTFEFATCVFINLFTNLKNLI